MSYQTDNTFDFLPYTTPRALVRGVVLRSGILQTSNEPWDPDDELPDD